MTDDRRPSRIPLPTVALHWAVGLGVIGVMAYGFWLGTLPQGPGKAPYIQVHKSFGLLVFALALARIGWRMRVGFPETELKTVWERHAARTAHYALLAATVIMPISGIVRSLAYARPVSAFGVPVIPQVFTEKHEGLYAVSSTIHDWTAWAFLAIIATHVLAAAKHHFMDGDQTFARMVRAERSREEPIG